MAKRRKSPSAASTRGDVVIGGRRMDVAYHVPAAQPTMAGPWRVEPDKVAWTDPSTGYGCIIRRERPGGHLGAYVGLPPRHPLHGWHADAVPTSVVDVPGGLDYAAACDDSGPEEWSICHVREAAADDLWWFGTRCNRLCDLVPDDEQHAEKARRFGIRQIYRDPEEVFSRCVALAAQLKAVEDEGDGQ